MSNHLTHLDLHPVRDAESAVATAVRALLAGDLEHAERLLCAALEAVPDHAHAHAIRGAVARRSGDIGRARRHLERAVEAHPSPEHLCNLASVCGELGLLDHAERHLRRALTLDSAHVEARVNLGTVLLESGRHEEALTHLDRAAALAPELPHAHWQTCMALKRMQRRLEALQAIRRFRAVAPDDPDGAFLCAQLMRDLGDAAGSAAAMREALALSPDAAHIRMELLFTLRQICAWEESAPLLAELLRSESCADVGGWVAPFFELSLPLSPDRLQRDASKHARDVARVAPVRWTRPAPCGKRRLRVGYVSADFRNHPLSHLMRGFFQKHDRDAIEAFVYSIGPDDGSAYRAGIVAAAEHFVDLSPLDIEGCVTRIRADEIDVLVDLMGYTSLNRFAIFAHRCAPVQATYMGFAGTLGSSHIDYQIVDETVVPPGLAPFFTERLLHLPDTYMVTDDEQPIAPDAPTRAQCGLAESAVVFACFNAPQKLEPEVFECWMRIMTRVGGSVLWLLDMPEAARQNLRAFASTRGVAPERVVFARREKKAAHLARLQLADLALDTFFFGAHTTAVDALWAGLPVISCPGDTFASRVGASVLRAMGLPELVARDRAAYEELAVCLALDGEERAQLRRRVAENRKTQPLFDTRRFARHFERGLFMMHEAAVAGSMPAELRVPRMDERRA
ncbi:MAG: hypothetical protein JWP97_6519 [Labilithrix sp.]|nr:hypothetical protein [Labilithrix sp.]